MILLVILFVISVHGNEDWVLSEFREAVVGYDTNLTSLMDPGEGCRWIFKSGSTECCYSDDTDQCEYKTHDKEKCRKNYTEFIVHPIYPARECVLQLFNIGYKDAGEYTQTTRTFNFSINLTVTRDMDWEKKYKKLLYEEDGLREAVVGYDTNLTSLMDPGEGCRWIFKSESTECCYSDDTDQCEYKTHDKEKCRKNHTEFIVHPTYPTQECVLQLFNIGYKDAGRYTQTTRTFNFSINLTVTGDKVWEIMFQYVFIIIFAIFISGTTGWTLRKIWKKRDEEDNV